jgi:hypothetical protein
MRTDPRPGDVRQLVFDILADQGAQLLAFSDLKETVLIDDGRYVARSYRAKGYMAMWLLDIGIVQFYNSEGDMLATINLFEALQPQRMAA